MQLHDLARQILVEPRRLPPAAIAYPRCKGTVGAEALCLIEKEQHRGVVDRGGQEVGKFAHDMRADRFILVIAGEADDGLFVRRDREMIGPEMDETFGEGGLRGDCGGEARARGFAIMAAESRARHAAHRLNRTAVVVAHFCILRFAAHRLPLALIFGIGGRDRLAPRQLRDRRGGGIIVADLADQPVFRVFDGRIVEAAAEPEAIGGKILDCHDKPFRGFKRTMAAICRKAIPAIRAFCRRSDTPG